VDLLLAPMYASKSVSSAAAMHCHSRCATSATTAVRVKDVATMFMRIMSETSSGGCRIEL
jgi:hypothetical protein